VIEFMENEFTTKTRKSRPHLAVISRMHTLISSCKPVSLDMLFINRRNKKKRETGALKSLSKNA
jgi:hypothetical protein